MVDVLILNQKVGSCFGPYFDGEGAIRSLENAGRWLEIILPVSMNKRNFCPVSCALYVCRNCRKLTVTNENIEKLDFN